MSRLSRFLVVAGVATFLACLDLFLSRGSFSGTVSPRAPKLLVLVVFDQLRGDYLQRWQALYGEGGFRRLQEEGAWFQNCHYPYGYTVTGAGHASLLTGCSPDRHGIVGNDWYERDAGEVYCVAADRHEQVPPSTRDPQTKKPRRTGGVSPERMLVPTLGDVLKDATGGKSKVVGLSFKDRSAILPTGHRADACYWFDGNLGGFVTSTFYGRRLHPWVARFNEERPGDAWFGRSWTPLRPDIDYARYSGADDVVGEGKGYAQGREFPHPMNGGAKTPVKGYYDALYNSPFGNDLLLDLAKRAIVAEDLGRHAQPDLLCISFSSNDSIGHTWGPDSQEVLDTTLRSDRTMKELLEFLDERVGKGNYVVALTADHGVCPLPEVSQARGIDAARVSDSLLKQEAEAFLAERHGTRDQGISWIEAVSGPYIYLNQKLIRERHLKPRVVETELAQWCRGRPGVHTAYTASQLESMEGLAFDDMGRRMARSHHPGRTGEVVIVPKPYYLFSSPFSSGTTHGTPHPYDTHVPLLVFGPGVKVGPHSEGVTPQAIAAIFAHFLGIPPPASAEAEVPKSLF